MADKTTPPPVSNPVTLSMLASLFATYNLCETLIDSGHLSQAAAAKVFTKTADQVRDATDDGAGAELGETIAGRLEQLASWSLGHTRKL